MKTILRKAVFLTQFVSLALALSLCLIMESAQAEEQKSAQTDAHQEAKTQISATSLHDTASKNLLRKQDSQDSSKDTEAKPKQPVGTWKRNSRGWWYELSDGSYLKNGIFTLNNTQYCFYSSGYMATGWVNVGKNWHHFNADGSMTKGWIFSSGAWYYLDNQGIMLANQSKEVNGVTYTFLANGAMRSGWIKDAQGAWRYYSTQNSHALSGWQKISGTWYYLDAKNDNRMLTGWLNDDGIWYYLARSGALTTGWAWIGSHWYYFAPSGSMLTGWQKISGVWYYLYPDNNPYGGSLGAMARNVSIDGYWLNSDGSYLTPAERKMQSWAQGYSSSTGWLVLVDRSNCKVGVFSGSKGNWSRNYFWDCAPGTAATPTVAGVFKIQAKGYYFDSGAARCYYYSQFHGNYLFHSVLYYKNGSLMDGRTGLQLSHGCVRLDIDNAKWIYDYIPRGTSVVIY